jgi:indole-3-glycerol phosphate synthase
MAKNSILKQIVAKKRERIALAKTQLPFEVLKEKIASLKMPARQFIKAISKSGSLSLIAEIKKASPSRGVIREDFNASQIAAIYQESGAQAISVLTEEDYFQGSLSYIQQVKNTVGLPVLRKDFIIDDYQVYESKFYGADAVLLIAELLTKERIREILEIARSLSLDCLVEVHEEKELKKILSLKDINSIGINNRNLNTLEVDFKTTERLYPLIPKDKIVVVESGIKRYQDMMFLKILGIKAVLIGEAFMEAGDIKMKVEELMG